MMMVACLSRRWFENSAVIGERAAVDGEDAEVTKRAIILVAT